jgi:hypothetical protein
MAMFLNFFSYVTPPKKKHSEKIEIRSDELKSPEKLKLFFGEE